MLIINKNNEMQFKLKKKTTDDSLSQSMFVEHIKFI